jgi:hypothetical protein
MTKTNLGSSHTLRFVGEVAVVSEAGLSLRPWYRSKPVLVPWSNVEFVCPVPFLVCEAGKWKTYSGKSLTPEALAQGLRIYGIHIVLRERQQLWRSFGLAGRAWLLVALGYKALMGADDKFDKKQGVVELDLHVRKLKSRHKDFVAFLDGLNQYSKFDLVGVGG